MSARFLRTIIDDVVRPCCEKYTSLSVPSGVLGDELLDRLEMVHSTIMSIDESVTEKPAPDLSKAWRQLDLLESDDESNGEPRWEPPKYDMTIPEPADPDINFKRRGNYRLSDYNGPHHKETRENLDDAVRRAIMHYNAAFVAPFKIKVVEARDPVSGRHRFSGLIFTPKPGLWKIIHVSNWRRVKIKGRVLARICAPDYTCVEHAVLVCLRHVAHLTIGRDGMMWPGSVYPVEGSGYASMFIKELSHLKRWKPMQSAKYFITEGFDASRVFGQVIPVTDSDKNGTKWMAIPHPSYASASSDLQEPYEGVDVAARALYEACMRNGEVEAQVRTSKEDGELRRRAELETLSKPSLLRIVKEMVSYDAYLECRRKGHTGGRTAIIDVILEHEAKRGRPEAEAP